MRIHGYIRLTSRNTKKWNGFLAKYLWKYWQEKIFNLWLMLSVPQTNTGAQVEKTKVYEWFFVKELGKQAAVTSG